MRYSVATGIGSYVSYYPPVASGKFKFIRGNHDDPDICRSHPDYLGDYGYIESAGIFYISGGFSIDKDYRIPGISWWEDEEMNYDSLGDMMKLFGRIKPEIVISHTCPQSVFKNLILPNLPNHIPGAPRTRAIMDACLEWHKPSKWYFSHFHIRAAAVIDGTEFYCINNHGFAEAPGLVF